MCVNNLIKRSRTCHIPIYLLISWSANEMNGFGAYKSGMRAAGADDHQYTLVS